MLELELLAVTWAATKCKLLIQGLPVVNLVVDHQPLIPIINHYTLDQLSSPRLQRLLEKLSAFNFCAVWRKGKDHVAPDALS